MTAKKPKRLYDDHKIERKHDLDARRDSINCVRFDIVDRKVLRNARRMFLSLPADTRNLTGLICGDPLPGRSALDRRESA